MSLLKVNDLVSYIGLFTILQGVSMEIQQGEAVAILGRNGAGKTTFLRTVMGLVKTRSGSITFNDASIIGKATHKISKLGIGYCPEDYGVFDLLTIEENLVLATHKKNAATRDRIAYVLDLFPDLKLAYKRHARTLSGGQRQMLSVGRSLVNSPALILIDEPSKGLAPVVIEKMALALKEIAKQSTIVLVEQNFHMALIVTDRYYIIDEGRTVHGGLMKDLENDKELQQRHLGL
ncbi:MAG: ABC transporter ATP-binding protein [Defluviitaleaceae bacterium]|nr:ABC transporter ATP-binding protein [Defluviitaleaceae bacterium]MCL2239593.1 ABC transporter ATP-binding protein [Defluviitaleaceae bacterium]